MIECRCIKLKYSSNCVLRNLLKLKMKIFQLLFGLFLIFFTMSYNNAFAGNINLNGRCLLCFGCPRGHVKDRNGKCRPVDSKVIFAFYNIEI